MKSKIISIIIYIISGILIIMCIPCSAGIAESYLRNSQNYKGYTLVELYDSFSMGQYEELYKKTSYNRAVNTEITDDTEDFYYFAQCFESAVNYHMYSESDMPQKAAEELNTFKENEEKLTHKIFKNALTGVKEDFNIK